MDSPRNQLPGTLKKKKRNPATVAGPAVFELPKKTTLAICGSVLFVFTPRPVLTVVGGNIFSRIQKDVRLESSTR